MGKNSSNSRLGVTGGPVETKLVERRSGKGIHRGFSHFLSFIVNFIKNKYIYVIVFFLFMKLSINY